MKFSPQVASYSLLLAAIIFICVKPARHRDHSKAEIIARGAYLVKLGGCADCHTPKVMTSRGPVDDETRRFAGHPADQILTVASLQDGPWAAATAGMTAWSGPWGVSYASNLTPDRSTGLWSEDVFVKAMRTGRHEGDGRAILPPMPWQSLAEASDTDLHAMYAYLRSLPPVFNRVPDPTPPPSETAVR